MSRILRLGTDSLLARVTSGERVPGTHSLSGRFGEEKNLLPLPGITTISRSSSSKSSLHADSAAP